MDTWEIEASSGTYLWHAETARKALFAFETASPDDFVHSVKRVVGDTDYDSNSTDNLQPLHTSLPDCTPERNPGNCEVQHAIEFNYHLSVPGDVREGL